MFGIFEFKRIDVRRAVATLMPVCLLLSVSPSIFAQADPCDPLSGANWCLRISEKENQFLHEHDSAWMMPLMWDDGGNRNDYYRNMPTLELSNIATAPGSPDIVRFELTIGDTRFHFGDSVLGTKALVVDSTPGFTLSPVASDDNKIIFDIIKQGGGGLAPGDLVMFRIDLDVDAGLTDPPFYMHPDYRTVLFDKNGVQVYGEDPMFPSPAEDNAVATVHFGDNTTAEQPFADETITDETNQYFNAIYHPRNVMEHVHIYGIGGGGPGGVIPEPGSAVLAVVGFFGGLFLGARSRRSATSA